jgi:SAM-dependent methyltransferase
VPHPQRDRLATGAFGGGSHALYDQALRDPLRSLFLHEEPVQGSAPQRAVRTQLDVQRFLATADEVDEAIVRLVGGPVLDVGCGPGRMVKAAILAGHLALGIDISPAAVEIATERGLPVLCRSVFHDVPSQGTWATAMLIDGNIGIGGDPAALLRRCAEVITGDGTGRVLVEAHEDPSADRRFQGMLVDDLARSSLPFPWAEVGVTALTRYAEAAGLAITRQWRMRERSFVEFACA